VTDPLEIFARAEDFRRTSILLINSLGAPKQIDATRLVPQAVNSAFSSELFLKCLHLLDHKKPAPMVHALDRLFALLNVSTQNEINRAWTKMRRTLPTKFLQRTQEPGLLECLKESSIAFEHYRYLFELAPVRYRIQNLPDVLRNVCVTRNPTWPSLYETAYQITLVKT